MAVSGQTTTASSQPPPSDLPQVLGYTVDSAVCGLGENKPVHIPSVNLSAGPDALEIDYKSFPFATPITWDMELPPTNCSVVVRYGFGAAVSAGWSAAFTSAVLTGQTDLKNGSWAPWINVTTEWSPDEGKSWIEPGKGAIVGLQGVDSFANGTFAKETTLDLTVWSPCGDIGDLLMRVNVTGRLVRSGDDTAPDSANELSVPGTLTNSLNAQWRSNACVTVSPSIHFK